MLDVALIVKFSLQRARRLTLQTVLLLITCLSVAAAQDTPAPDRQTTQQSRPAAPETPQQQTNPAVQSNLPNAPSSLITAKPHGQGKIPLEDIPHPPVKLKQMPLNIAGDSYRIFTSPLYIRTGDLKWMLPVAAATGVALSQDTHVAKDIVSHDPASTMPTTTAHPICFTAISRDP